MLRKFWFFFWLVTGFWIITINLNAQILENFENGDLLKFRQIPMGHWNISSEQALGGTKSLRQWSDSIVPTEDRISISLAGLAPEQDTVCYRFRLKHGSNPSSSNRWAIYLAYDEDAAQMHPGGSGNGYLLGVNLNSTDDNLKFFKINGGIIHEILNTKFNWETSVGILHAGAMELRRSPEGNWSVYIDKTGSFDSLRFYGSVLNNEISAFLYFGIYYDYTSTRNGMLWFDDLRITGRFNTDTIAPRLKSVTVLSDSSLALSFSEYMNWNIPELNSGLTLEEANQIPDNVIVISKDSLLLKFESRFKDNCWYHLVVKDLKDLFGNRMKAETDSFFYSPIKLNDICINEILPDPSPVVRLPEFEFIELYNRTGHSINLSGWTIICGDVFKTLPSFILSGNEYLVLCQSSAVNSFSACGKTLGIFTSASFLSNAGSCIQLHSSEGTLISYVCYSPEWITDVNKIDGGWSLERIDPEIPCPGKENWTVSKDKNGGTPGRQNSVFRAAGDHISPLLKGVFPDTDSSLLIKFSETIGLNYITNPSAFNVDHNIGIPESCNSIKPEYSQLYLNFKNHFQKDTLYTISHDGSVQDCAGNHAEAGNYKFLLPSLPDSQDVVINEVMYHPVSGCPEFIEIYNRSKKAFRLGDFRIAIANPYSGELKSISDGIPESRLFMPAEFILLTSNPDEMKSCYPQSVLNTIVAFNGVPELTDDGQKLQLISKDLSVIDQMSYKDAMQFALLTNSIGVSLERVDYYRSSMDPGNWHSASSGSGFCTPGFENSQLSESENSNSVLHIEPEIFSPDNDGNDDIVNILYSFDKPGFVGNLFIFDSRGRQVKRIANNELLACKGQFSWDGVSESGSAVQPGIYIVLFEVFNLSGRTEKYKKICVVSRTR